MEEKMKKCPYCGQEIMAMAKKCRYCGMWVDGDDDRMVECPACGERVDKRSKVCPYCHEPLSAEGATEASDAPATPMPGGGASEDVASAPEEKKESTDMSAADKVDAQAPVGAEGSQPDAAVDDDNVRRPDSIFRVHDGFGRYYSWGCFILVFLMILGNAVGAVSTYKMFQGVSEFGVENAGKWGHFIYFLEIIPDWLATLMSDGGLLFCFIMYYVKLKKCYKPLSGLAIALIVLQGVSLLVGLTDQYVLGLLVQIALLVVLTIFGVSLRNSYDGPLKTLGTWSIIYVAVLVVTMVYIGICESSGDMSLFFMIVLLAASLACYDQFAKAVE